MKKKATKEALKKAVSENSILRIDFEMMKQKQLEIQDKLLDTQKECLSIRSKLKDKLETTEFIEFQTNVASLYAAKKSIKEIYSLMNKYLKREEFDDFSEEFDSYKQDVETSYYNRKEVQKMFQDLDSKVQNTYQTKENLAEKENKIYTQIEEISEKLDEESDKSRKQHVEINKNKQEILAIYKKIATKASQEEIKQLNDKAQHFVEKTELENLKKKVFPEVTKMKRQDQHNKIIERFDEVLLEKASKTSVQQVLHKLKMEYPTKNNLGSIHDSLDTKLTNNLEKI